MKEDESIHDFHMNVVDIANASGALGEKIYEANMISKILRYLPKKFDMKVTAIQEAQDINTMKVDDLMGSLQTFEMGHGEKSEKKKSVTFVSNAESPEDKERDLSEDLVLLGRQFNKVLKKIDWKSKPNVKNKYLDISRAQDGDKKSNTEEQSNQGKGVQCQECEGYGHIRAGCPTYLKKQRKGLVVSWSEDKSEKESGGEEFTFEEMLKSYKELFLKSTKADQNIEVQKEIIAQLHNEKVVTALIAHTSLRSSTIEDWYFDSGCSKHMTSMKKFPLDIKPRSNIYVTFVDGSKGEIKGVSKLDHVGQPSLDNVLLVKGLTANLISISQLCDQGLRVNFNDSECLVTSEGGKIIMKGTRSKDNCYLWSPQETKCFSFLINVNRG
ncbi:uncharacterized protein LOC131657673 [Vicia villosa]|uniref:uncharacterized protein LOC131657673 n=1 Tax=Vicia villosa TaxID=3911 RepID=UPI00273C3522|nr:uncharacterized protein LOC131657673 [Vicia villosa]